MRTHTGESAVATNKEQLLARLRAETSAFMKGAKLGSPLEGLTPKQMKTETTACKHARETVSGPDKREARDGYLPLLGRIFFHRPIN
jgi:hypothetical protein